MSRSFADPTKAEESFQILDQLQDPNLWKILTDLVDPNTSFHQTREYRVIYSKTCRYGLDILIGVVIAATAWELVFDPNPVGYIYKLQNLLLMHFTVSL